MKPIEFELERTIAAPVESVFARIVDLDGWTMLMSGKGSMLRSTRQTSPGPVAVGTTYVDETSQGPTPGEVVELEEPRKVLFHWWDTNKAGKVTFEGWPGFVLEPQGVDRTRVRHTARLQVNGVWQLGRPVFSWLARRERSATLEALADSLEER